MLPAAAIISDANAVRCVKAITQMKDRLYLRALVMRRIHTANIPLLGGK